MAKLSLLDLAQDIASDMNSDEFNSINDSVEAQQIAQIIKTTYFEIISSRDWPHLSSLFQLTATSTSTPSHMKLPENAQKVCEINYDKRTSTDTVAKYAAVGYLEPTDFLAMSNNRHADSGDVDTITDFGGGSLNIVNNTAPTYYTSFDDEYIVFDSYDNTVDSTLQTSKINVIGYREPTFTIEDTFIPDLPSKVFPYLLAEAKSTAFLVLTQEANQKAEQQSRRQRVWTATEKFRTNRGINFDKANYGRQSSVFTRNPLFGRR